MAKHIHHPRTPASTKHHPPSLTTHHRARRPRLHPHPSHTPTQYLTLLLLHLLALTLRLLSLLTSLLVPAYHHLTTALTTLRTPTLLDTLYFDVFLFAFLLCYFPAWVWWGVKVAAKGLLGHAVFGALAVGWFEKCAGEWVPVVRVAGWEVVVRGEGRGKVVGNELVGKIVKKMVRRLEEWVQRRGDEGRIEKEVGVEEEKNNEKKDGEKKDGEKKNGEEKGDEMKDNEKKDNEKDDERNDEKHNKEKTEMLAYSGVAGELFTLGESGRVEVGEGWLGM